MAFRWRLSPLLLSSSFFLKNQQKFSRPFSHVPIRSNQLSLKSCPSLSLFFSTSFPTKKVSIQPPPIQTQPSSPSLPVFEIPSAEKKWGLWLVGYYGKHQTRLRKVHHLYKEMVKQVEHPFFLSFYQSTDEKLRFQQWFSVAAFHFWICSVHFRQAETREARKMMEELFTTFWKDSEKRILESGISELTGKALILGKQQKVFLKQYMGMMVSLDEGLVYSDTLLSEAIWRNLFFMEDPTAEGLSFLAQYARQQIFKIKQNPNLLFENAHIDWIDLQSHIGRIRGPPPSSCPSFEVLQI
mmetsp:Transcript_33829/g.46292  ORF Transcript_33829/g.46292 Transcript_33829/m.46292 type:complete len:298 (+) Transcript_33829:1-894(+)